MMVIPNVHYLNDCGIRLVLVVCQSATDVVTCKTAAYVRVKFQCDLFRSLLVCVCVCANDTYINGHY